MGNSLGKIVKNAMHTHDQKMELIYCFNWVNYKYKLECLNQFVKNGNGLRSWKLCRLHNVSLFQLYILYNAILASLAALYGANYAGNIGT